VSAPQQRTGLVGLDLPHGSQLTVTVAGSTVTITAHGRASPAPTTSASNSRLHEHPRGHPMSNNQVEAKQDVIGARFTDTLTSNGAVVDLTGATVQFLMEHTDGTKIAETATIVSPASGTVRYVTAAGDLAKVGEYRQEWKATLADGSVLRFPSGGWNKVKVIDNLT